jgi:hypothetical protein
VALPQAGAGPPEEVPSALDDMRQDGFPEPLVDPDEIISGGPPPDGIPAIDEPTFLKVPDVDFLTDTEAVLALTLGGETRGYPIQILTYHEIVNDTVGDVPVAVTYCPLCNSGLAFERQVGDRLLSFGTSGRLWSNNLVMYDRQTESLWPQLSFTASVGELTGAKLVPHLTSLLAWDEFREAHPDAWVLSRDTGYDRPYGRNPYLAYDQPDGQPLFGAPDDDRLAPQVRVVGIEDETGDGTPVALVRDELAAAGVMELTIGDTELVAWHRAGQASALDAGEVAGGRDIGTVGVFVPEAGGQRLTFTAAGEDGFRDAETGSTWNVLGLATAGPLAGEQLPSYRHVDTFWHSWVAFQPETTILR